MHCRLKELPDLYPLVLLERVYLGMNRLQDFSELEKLAGLPRLVELSLIGNPVSSYV